jgi:hypothetical protein
MNFDDYLRLKKIDPARFAETEPAVYADWKRLFEQLSPDSFTAQKKFLLNATRRTYLIP